MKSTKASAPNKVNMDLERKKASQIMHYLMDRKNEQEYQDPFELLKNMNDVILCYEPKPKKSNDPISLDIDTGSDPNATASTFNAGKTQTHFGQTKYSGFNRIGLDDIQTDATSLPSIKQNNTVLNKSVIQGNSAIKTIAQKKKDQLLDIGNIPEVSQIFDGLDTQYERIKKLKEQFKDIQSQFGIAPLPQAAPANHTSFMSKRPRFVETSTESTRVRGQTSSAKNVRGSVGEVVLNKDLPVEQPAPPKTQQSQTNIGQQQPTIFKQKYLKQRTNTSVNQYSSQNRQKQLNNSAINTQQDINKLQYLSQRKPIRPIGINKSINDTTTLKQSIFKNLMTSPKPQIEERTRNESNDLPANDSTSLTRKSINTAGYFCPNQLKIQKVRSQALERFTKLQSKSNNVSTLKDPQQVIDTVKSFMTKDDGATQNNLPVLPDPINSHTFYDKFVTLNASSTTDNKENFYTAETQDGKILPSLNNFTLSPYGTQGIGPIHNNFTPELGVNTTYSTTNQQKVHAGVSLYEQYKLNQQKQLKILKKKEKKAAKKALRLKQQALQSVEGIYMRQAILQMLANQGPSLKKIVRSSSKQNQSRSKKGGVVLVSGTKRNKSSVLQSRRNSDQIIQPNTNLYQDQIFHENNHIILQNPSYQNINEPPKLPESETARRLLVNHYDYSLAELEKIEQIGKALEESECNQDVKLT